MGEGYSVSERGTRVDETALTGRQTHGDEDREQPAGDAVSDVLDVLFARTRIVEFFVRRPEVGEAIGGRGRCAAGARRWGSGGEGRCEGEE